MSSPFMPEDSDFDASIVLASDADIVVNKPLTSDEARALTDTIRNAVDVLWVLIVKAHSGKAWAALGYDTWADYVQQEFNMSRSRSYQLLDQARVVQEIEAALPEGTKVSISEAAARDLKGVLEEVVPEIKERTEGLDPDEASDILDEIVAEKRERLKEEKDAALADAELDDEYFGAEFDDDYSGGGRGPGSGGGAFVDDDMYDDDDDDKPSYGEIDDVDVVAIRKAVNAAHDLYSSLSALAGLPSNLEEVVDIIPRERYAQIESNLERAQDNLAKFAGLWAARNEDENEENE